MGVVRHIGGGRGFQCAMADPDPSGSAENPFSFKTFVTRRSVDVVGSEEIEERAQRGRKKGGRRKTYAGSASGGGGREGELPFPELEAEGKEEGVGTKENPFSFKTFIARKEIEQIKPNFRSETKSDEGDMEAQLCHPLSTDNVPFAQTTSSGRMTKLNSAKLPKKGDSSVTKTTSKLRSSSDRHHKKGSRGHAGMTKLFPDSQSESSESDEDLKLPFPVPVPPLAEIGTRPSSVPAASDPLGSLDISDSSGLLMQPVVATERDADVTNYFKGTGRNKMSDSESSSEAFLHTDGGVLGGEPRLLAPVSSGDSRLETMRLMEEMQELRAENERLKEELQQTQDEARKQTNALQVEIKALKKKETEDTKALENMVLKVEENLVTTTKRATSAEATIVKLKQEIQTLQAQLAQSSPQSVHQYYEETLAGVRDKAGFASQQLFAAAHQADQSIRDLVSGVETLKNVAEILEFIDRISEAKRT